MALENKKSLLQPSSTQAQQYRLQFSNLVDRVGEVISYNSTEALVPQASQFAPPVSQTTGTSETPDSSGASVTSGTSGGTAITYSEKAADFDGSFFFTASNADLGFSTPSGSYSYGVMFKPDKFIAGHTQTIFHTYTGSFASHSIELSITGGGEIQLKYAHGGGYIRYRVPQRQYKQYARKSANEYTFIEFAKLATADFQTLPLANARHLLKINGQNLLAFHRSSNAAATNVPSFDISNNDNFYIGGTAARSGTNFSGSIAFVYFGSGLITQDHLDLRDGLRDVSNTRESSIAKRARAYKFNTTGAVEYTGTLATTQVPLGLSGSYAYVDSYK